MSKNEKPHACYGMTLISYKPDPSRDFEENETIFSGLNEFLHKTDSWDMEYRDQGTHCPHEQYLIVSFLRDLNMAKESVQNVMEVMTKEGAISKDQQKKWIEETIEEFEEVSKDQEMGAEEYDKYFSHIEGIFATLPHIIDGELEVKDFIIAGYARLFGLMGSNEIHNYVNPKCAEHLT